ncbi:unnamed protein product [Parnassius mnemosyne]|uniref:Peptidase M12A domain-containing protein n=1 Tax=Parnassius mnemosyne TaxID=213953 RepID=A0AAV1LVG5_9NEOP
MLPENWPSNWNSAVIPYTFNFYSPSSKRLISLVKKGLSYIEERSCLTFEEYDPRELAELKNFTYIYFSYSGVLEDCCLPFFKKRYGRRLVLITPLCTLPAEVAHATMHAFGLHHQNHQPFQENKMKALLFHNDCQKIEQKLDIFESRMKNMYDVK